MKIRKRRLKQWGIVLVLFSGCLSGCGTLNHSPAADNNLSAQIIFPFPDRREAAGHKVFIFDPRYARYALYDEEGHLVYEGRATGGKDYCPDINNVCQTPVGAYTIYRKEGADCKSTKFPVGKGGAPMPYCMFFYQGSAIHGSNDVSNRNTSHGCIHVTPKEAKWLNEEQLNIGDTVIVRPYPESEDLFKLHW